MQRYVCGFMFSEHKDSVLLIRKKKPAWQAGKLNGVGGKIEPGESPGDAMVREFHEETGLVTSHRVLSKPHSGDLSPTWEPFVILTGLDYRVYFYRARGFISEAQSMTQEPVVPAPLPFSHDVNVLPNLRWLVPLALDTLVQFPLHVEEI